MQSDFGEVSHDFLESMEAEARNMLLRKNVDTLQPPLALSLCSHMWLGHISCIKTGAPLYEASHCRLRVWQAVYRGPNQGVYCGCLHENECIGTTQFSIGSVFRSSLQGYSSRRFPLYWDKTYVWMSLLQAHTYVRIRMLRAILAARAVRAMVDLTCILHKHRLAC